MFYIIFWWLIFGDGVVSRAKELDFQRWCLDAGGVPCICKGVFMYNWPGGGQTLSRCTLSNAVAIILATSLV